MLEKQCGTGRVPSERSSIVSTGYCRKSSGIERVPSERLARPLSQACTRIAVQPAVQVLASSRAHLQQMLKKSRASRTPRALRGSRKNSSRTKIKQNKNCFVEIKILVHRFSRVRSLLYKWLAIGRRACLCMCYESLLRFVTILYV